MVKEPAAHYSLSEHSHLSGGKNLLNRLGWLSPTGALRSRASKEFGRKIEATLNEINQSNQALRIQLRKNDAAVVLSVAQYEELLIMKSLCDNLINDAMQHSLNREASEFDELFNNISSEKSRAACDNLFSASEDEINKRL